MQRIVKVTRRGQTTIPKEIRKKYGIREGDDILVEDEDGKIVIRIIPKIEELAGIDTEFGTPEEMKAEVERLRKEYR